MTGEDQNVQIGLQHQQSAADVGALTGLKRRSRMRCAARCVATGQCQRVPTRDEVSVSTSRPRDLILIVSVSSRTKF